MVRLYHRKKKKEEKNEGESQIEEYLVGKRKNEKKIPELEILHGKWLDLSEYIQNELRDLAQLVLLLMAHSSTCSTDYATRFD
jgi:hypothetical protein